MCLIKLKMKNYVSHFMHVFFFFTSVLPDSILLALSCLIVGEFVDYFGKIMCF